MSATCAEALTIRGLSVRYGGVSAVTDVDATSAGYESAAAMMKGVDAKSDVPLYRIDFHFAGTDDPRADLAADGVVTDDDIEEITRRLDRLDAAVRWVGDVGRRPSCSPAARVQGKR